LEFGEATQDVSMDTIAMLKLSRELWEGKQ